ncbi:hypothetical protein PJP10_32165, partial [Mycobacterium kansasii]
QIKDMEKPISHIQYADDTLLFCEADWDKVGNLRRVIRCFEAVSGLKVNLNKSKLIGVNISDSETHRFAEFFGCTPDSLPTNFVDLPL